MSNSVRPHRRQPNRRPHPWDSPGKNTGVGCHFLLQCMKVKSEVTQSCPTLSDPMDCSLPGSSVHGIFQARVLELVAIAFSWNNSLSLIKSIGPDDFISNFNQTPSQLIFHKQNTDVTEASLPMQKLWLCWIYSKNAKYSEH